MIWKIIRQNTNYSINEHGEIKNNSTGLIKKPFENHRNGYLYVDLWKENKVKKYAIHRLIAEYFIPNPFNKPTVDHIDGNRKNNTITNLRWATYSEQNSRFDTHGVRSEKVLVTEKDIDKKMVFESITDVADYFGVCISSISQMLKKGTFGKRGKTRNYKFEYMQK